MRWWWVALIVWTACRDPGRGPAPVVAPAAPATVTAAGPLAHVGAFTQPPMPSRSSMCNAASCSGHGRCVTQTRYPYLSGDVSASCQCEPGFYAYGLECVACTPVGATHDIDLRVARFRGRVTWNGRDVPKDLAGDVYLVSEGDVGTRGDVVLGRGRFDVGVLAGRYDIVLRERGRYYEDTELVVAKGVSIRGTTTLDIALPLERVTAKITFAGAPPPAGTDKGQLLLLHPNGQIFIPIARDPIAMYLPRTKFDVTYIPPRGEEPSLPPVSVILRLDVAVDHGVLALDIPVVQVEGRVTGLTAPFDLGMTMVSFATTRGGYGDGAVDVALAAPEFTAILVPGRYDVWLSTQLRGRSFSVRIAAGVEVRAGARLDLALIPPTQLTGRFLIDGTARDMVLVAIGEGDVLGAARISLDPDGTFAATLPRGAYTLAVEQDPGDSMAGVLALDRITLTNELRWELDLPTVEVGATVTIDGSPATPPTAGMGALELSTIGSPVSYAIWPKPARLPPGSYRPYFGFGSPEPAGFPAVSDLPRTPIEITRATTLAIDVSTRRLTGKLTVDGKRSKSSATIALTGRNDGDHLGEVSAGRYTTVVVPGSYAVSFFDAFAESEDHAPRNTRFNLGCITVK